MTFSAASTESYVGVKVPNIYFKSDLQNSDVVYFEVEFTIIIRIMTSVRGQMSLTTSTICMTYYRSSRTMKKRISTSPRSVARILSPQ